MTLAFQRNGGVSVVQKVPQVGCAVAGAGHETDHLMGASAYAQSCVCLSVRRGLIPRVAMCSMHMWRILAVTSEIDIGLYCDDAMLLSREYQMEYPLSAEEYELIGEPIGKGGSATVRQPDPVQVCSTLWRPKGA